MQPWARFCCCIPHGTCELPWPIGDSNRLRWIYELLTAPAKCALSCQEVSCNVHTSVCMTGPHAASGDCNRLEATHSPPLLCCCMCAWQEDGSYAGFDPKEFTSRSHGKAAAIREIKVGYGSYRRQPPMAAAPLSSSVTCLSNSLCQTNSCSLKLFAQTRACRYCRNSSQPCALGRNSMKSWHTTGGPLSIDHSWQPIFPRREDCTATHCATPSVLSCFCPSLNTHQAPG